MMLLGTDAEIMRSDAWYAEQYRQEAEIKNFGGFSEPPEAPVCRILKLGDVKQTITKLMMTTSVF
jgi:hypothetical protein